MKFPWSKKDTTQNRRRVQQQAGQFAVGGYVSRRPQPTKPPKGLYRRGITRSGSTKYGLKKLNSESLQDATPRERIIRLQGLKTKLLFGQWVSVILGVTLLFLSYNFIARTHVSLVGDAEVRSMTADERDLYVESIQDYLDKRPFERLAFVLDQDSLTKHVVDQQAEIKSVRLNGLSGFGEYAFEVQVRKPVASWRMSGETFFVDDTGVAFKDNLYEDPGVSIVDNSGARSEEGDVLISASFLRFVGRAISFSAQRGYTVTEVTIPPLAFRQVEFTIDGLPYKVLMTTSRNAGVQVEDMDNAIKHFVSQGRNPNYIDVRVEGRAFFRD